MMESLSYAKERYKNTPPKYNSKRVFSGRSILEPEVVEISPPPPPSKVLKQKEVAAAYHEIIDVDMDDEDRKEVLIVIEGGDQVQSNKKMKGGDMGITVGPSNAQQGSMHTRGQTRKKLDSKNFIDLDDDDEDDDSMALQLQSMFDHHIPPPPTAAAGLHAANNNNSSKNHHPVGVDTSFSTMYPIVAAGNNNNPRRRVSSLTGSCSRSMGKRVVKIEDDDVVEKYKSFKKFDIAVDFSDHYYATQSSGMMQQPPKNWSKKIQDEWRMLEEHLPETICVRAYETRMDLLRAVIIGAEGTPYHDGLFFFDVCFQTTYPHTPPLVYYHCGGLVINPNLCINGKVCLSLLNTWWGDEKERWVPGTSTMLQVLVSIQGIVLNSRPVFNIGNYEIPKCWYQEKGSRKYNETILRLSLKTMVYTMNNPPKNFEDFVRGHFRKRARDILMACKAYTEGVQVGCVVRGGVHDVDEGSDNYAISCSAAFFKASCCYDAFFRASFKAGVAAYVKTLVAAFKSIGAAKEEVDEFIWLSEKKIRNPSHLLGPHHVNDMGF